MKKIKKYIYPALIVLFSAVLIGSSVYLIDYFVSSKKQKDQYDELSGLVEQIQQQQNNGNGSGNLGSTDIPDAPVGLPEYVDVVHPETGATMQILREYAPVFERNCDMVGWLKIPGTNINYPVLQTPEDPDFYLKRDFYKESSRHGSIFASELADVERPSDNITLYGHRMADGSMFAALHKYIDPAFYEQYPYITFDTITQYRRYQIVAVFRTTATADSYPYHTFVDGNVIAFTEFMNNCRDLAFYDTDVPVAYGDNLLTLSTCDKSIEDGRLVVVCRRVL